jgi:UDP-glucuronate decarboxylase
MHADDERVVFNVVSQALGGPDITIYGNGSQTRSVCYGDDMVQGLRHLMAYDGEQPGPIISAIPLN